MIKIADVYYELNLKDIILELKLQLELNNIFLFNQIKDLPNDLMVSCPFHKNGQERKASCGIRKEDGFLHCFTCGETATLEQLISRCFGYNDLGQYGLKWLKNNFLGDILQNREIDLHFERDLSKPEMSKIVTEKELNEYRFYHPYMFQRRLTEDIIQKFDIGFDKSTNCLTFPVKNENGECLFVARRSVVGKFFNYPSMIQKPVYGLYELKKYGKNVEEVIICESMLNALTCWVYGKYAVALNGTGTPYQYDLLKRLKCRKLILGLDPDSAGRKGAIRLYQSLKNYKLITFLKGIPNGKDINDLNPEDFNKCYETFNL